jgi:hypothetical protein
VAISSPLASIPHPAPDEADALAVAARYLHRASTSASTRLLSLPSATGDAALMATLRDSLLSAGEQCDGILELQDEQR